MSKLEKHLTKSINRFSVTIATYLCNNLKSNQRDKLRKFVRNFYNHLENLNYQFETNGEERILQILKNFDVETIFDVGANVGNWSKVALSIFKDADIHCFEIVPDTYKILVETLSEFDNVILNNIGLSNQEEDVYVNYSVNASVLSSLHQTIWQPTEKIKSYVSTGDKYSNNKKINKIDLLKIDTENHDFYVLQGFENMFKEDRIRFVQFEYGRGSIIT